LEELFIDWQHFGVNEGADESECVSTRGSSGGGGLRKVAQAAEDWRFRAGATEAENKQSNGCPLQENISPRRTVEVISS